MLVVDDDDSIRVMVAKVFERHNFDVSVARDGQEAIDFLAGNETFDAVLLDLMMPRVDGFGVMDYLRLNRPAMLEKVVIMTAFTTAAREKLEPNCRLVAKPFDVLDLVKTVRTCLALTE